MLQKFCNTLRLALSKLNYYINIVLRISGFDVADAIIFRYLPQGKKVNAFADSESATGYALKDNHYNYAFYLYVR